jgi:ribA/ribD-fused uncharacterized protein
MEKKISGFRGEWNFLSNFYKTDVMFEGEIYPSAEHAYQAAKTLDGEIRKKFIGLSSSESKRFGRSFKAREDWNDIKLKVMYSIVLDKFTRNDYMTFKLEKTLGYYIEEQNFWNDKFWGICKGQGENNLGKILMKVRNKIFLNNI